MIHPGEFHADSSRRSDSTVSQVTLPVGKIDGTFISWTRDAWKSSAHIAPVFLIIGKHHPVSFWRCSHEISVQCQRCYVQNDSRENISVVPKPRASRNLTGEYVSMWQNEGMFITRAVIQLAALEVIKQVKPLVNADFLWCGRLLCD